MTQVKFSLWCRLHGHHVWRHKGVSLSYWRPTCWRCVNLHPPQP